MDITVPKVGLTVETLEVVAWLREAGDAVCSGEPVCELAADKADIEIEAPAAGTLAEIRAPAGATVRPGDVLAVLAVDGVAGTNGARLRISPLARRVAAHRGVEVAVLTGTGPRGRILRRDVEAHLAASDTPAPVVVPVPVPVPVAEPLAEPVPSAIPGPPPDRAEDDLHEVRWTAARRATARAMALSAANAAPVTLHRRAGADSALAAVKRLKAAGLPATFTHAVVAATAHALEQHPALNAVWDGERLLRSRRRHVGLAVDDDGDLLLGVVADADVLDTTGLVVAAVEAVVRAKARTAPASRPTFTISNLGMFGVEQFTPIISPPTVAVLGVGAVVDGRCHLSLTFDHRAVDGAPAARFLATVADRLQTFDGR